MPARSTSRTKSAAKKPAVKKKPASTPKTKPVARKAAASKPASAAKKAAPKSPKPATITVGDTQYVLGEYGMLMSKDEYDRMMAKKLSG